MLIAKLKKSLSGAYIRNVGWLAGAETGKRIMRLGTTVILARMFSAQDYGLMAIIHTVTDFFHVFTLRGGVGSKIIQADEQEVQGICNTAYWLNWIVCGSLFIIQCLVALLLPYFSEERTLTLPLIALAFTYLTYPLFTIHLTLIERENRFKASAIFNVVISLIVSILTAIFALLGMGIWSILWSVILSSPVKVYLAWKYQPWRPPLRFTLDKWREVFGFGSNLLLNDLLNRFRSNMDYLIVGRYLGVEALGMYYFAFNAGSGITTSILATFMSPMYPYICAVRNNYSQFKKRYFSSLKKVTLVLVPLILLQASLAPIYVPIVFGKKWIPAIPILILICLSVIPRIYGWAATLLLNSINRPRMSLQINFISNIIFIISLFAVAKNGIIWVAATVLINNITVVPILTIWSNRFALNKRHFPETEI